VYHFLVQELFGAEKYQKFDAEEVAGTLAAIWLDGMQSGANRSNGRNGHNGHVRSGNKTTK
jgi:hypothetical protein